MQSGFTASARVVTAAALIMFAVFAAFVPEGDASLKPIALGLAVGIVIDAFLVRMTLIPAVMALLGEKAWWMPRWLDRVLPHFDIEGEAVERELALDGLARAGHDRRRRRRGRRRRAPATCGSSTASTCASSAAARSSSPATDARGPRALLLALAGRAAPTTAALRVAGHLLPGPCGLGARARRRRPARRAPPTPSPICAARCAADPRSS